MSDKWQNISAGPRQVADLKKAMGQLHAEGKTQTEVTGVIGGESREWHSMSLLGPVRPEVAELDEKIRAEYGHAITRDNVRAIAAAYLAALPEARKSRPVEDNRRTPEQEAERTAAAAARDAEVKAEEDKRDAVQNAVMARMPRGAKAVIIAEYHEDASDIMTDYFASHTARTVAIGWRYSSREDFRALRSAAAQFSETATLAEGMTEHRDNHSMGAGNYLSDHGWAGSGTGWLIKSRALPSRYLHLTEDAIPEPPCYCGTEVYAHEPYCTGAPQAPASASDGAVTVSPSSLGKPGVIELRFAEKPAEDVREALKFRARFRWYRPAGCWYGRQDAYEAARAAGYPLPALPGSEPEPASAPAALATA
jgi:hypothetical protein